VKNIKHTSEKVKKIMRHTRSAKMDRYKSSILPKMITRSWHNLEVRSPSENCRKHVSGGFGLYRIPPKNSVRVPSVATNVSSVCTFVVNKQHINCQHCLYKAQWQWQTTEIINITTRFLGERAFSVAGALPGEMLPTVRCDRLVPLRLMNCQSEMWRSSNSNSTTFELGWVKK